MQETFQVVIATDGITSFAILIYLNPDRTFSITADDRDIGLIGFGARDLRRNTVILGKDKLNFELEYSNVFRIDGQPLI